ncbi:hypothetical protein Poly30_30940 [Planctomycetes bacterium Poly30]|uniref:Uncharacterized protein n=1 Tax=Saltatorellus ferox TaxID=2528018 RepID=A0A518EU25_9BACT|nr:hypothetical protein Poly30_30940 [Planctomycetes bacterium Poly30]
MVVPACPRRFVSLFGLALFAGCHGTPGSAPSPVTLEVETVSSGASLVVHRVYTAAFDALEAALESDDLLVARSTLQRLQQRLAVDRATAPTLAEARQRDDDIAARTLGGELPSAENVQAALKMAEGFERVIEGRLRMAAIEMELELERKPGTEVIEIYLVAKSTWPQPLVLEPGAGRLEVLRASLEPRTGGERREARIRALEGGTRLEIPARGTVRALLTEVPVEVPVGSIATRMETQVTFNGGTVSEGDLMLPMREEDLPRTRRTDLAGWVPTSLVEPVELAELVERGGAPLAALLERAVRISPTRRDETLDRLGKVVQTLPIDAFHSIVPALRWIVGTNEFGRDEKRWRDWLIERYEARAAEGRAIGG